MAVVIRVDSEGATLHGEKMIRGSLAVGTYATDGAALNLANYFKSTTYPSVLITSGSGYALEHNQGTAASGKIKAYFSEVNQNGANDSYALVEVTNATDLSAVNIPFVAFGQPF